MTSSEKKLFLYITQECIRNNITLSLKPKGSIISDKIRVDGDYDEKHRIIRVEYDIKDSFFWITTLAHEFCHSIQDRKQKPYWEKCNNQISHTYGDSTSSFFCWLDGKTKLSGDIVWQAMANTRNMELECEKMTTNLIKRFDLGNLTKYIKLSNIYIYFYTFAFHYGKWWKKSPFQFPEIMKTVPGKFLLPKEYNKLPKDYEEIVKEKCL